MITVLGDGSFGTALAQVLARNGHTVLLWCYNQEVDQAITSTRRNERYLPGIELEPTIRTTLCIEEALHTASWIVEAIPMAYLSSVLSQVTTIKRTIPWVLASKGITQNKLPSELLHEILGELPIVILSGPSFAHQLASGTPTGVTLASSTHAEEFKQMLESDMVYIDMTTDIIGTQLCGAFKNVIALTLGILDGAGYESNTQALIFTKMIQELSHIITDKGGSLSTIMQLAGIGDLTLTAYTDTSRNRTLGKAIGEKKYLEKPLPYTEGINTLRSLPGYLKKRYPLFSAVHNIVLNQQPVNTLFSCIKK